MASKFQKFKSDFLVQVNNKSILRIPYFVLTISLIVTVAITYFYYSSAKRIDSDRFRNQTNRIKEELENRLDTYIALLRAGRGFFYAKQDVDRLEFNRFIENLNLRKNYPGVYAIGYARVIKADEKDAVVAQMRREGAADFSIKPDLPARDEYRSIVYIEPLDERNRLALGYDMSTEANRKAAMDTACDTGVYATSGRVTLVQETEPEAPGGFLIYVPVYKSGTIPATVEERRRDLKGFLYSPFRSGEFVKDVTGDGTLNEVAFRIYDNEFDESNLLATANPDEKMTEFPLEGRNEIEFNNRKWVIVYTSTSRFHKQSLIWWTPIIFFLGLAISVILFFLSLSQSRTNQNLIRTANDVAVSAATIRNLLVREQEARGNAEKSAKVKDEFLATVSHELRTPLNVIGGWVNILKLSGVDDEIKRRAIETINKSLRAQANLVEQMLIFSDKEFLVNPEKWQKIGFTGLVDECLEKFDGRLKDKKLTLEKHLPDTDLGVLGDRDKLTQALSCLLDNSTKFTPPSGTIVVDLQRNGDRLFLRIDDTGEGISPEMLPHIFEGFRQSDSSTVRRHSGIGLGLAISKKIFEAHQGTIEVQSEGPQKGSSIIVTLPLAR
jgi:signal transduction histidine kinase